MNYFTKGWYELCQKISAHLHLEEEKEAEYFSEEYFQQLYNQKLMKWLSSEEQVASYRSKTKASKEGYIPCEPFDREKAIERFRKKFTHNQDHVKKILPEEILKEIVDIRVYVLNKASRKVKNAVTQFCEDNKKSIERTAKEYQNYKKQALKTLDIDIVKKIRFHDCVILDVKQTDQYLSIIFDNPGGFRKIDEIQFENYQILKQEASLQNLWWLYDEIYKTNGKYELQVLLQNENMDLIEFTVSAEYIVFKHNQ